MGDFILTLPTLHILRDHFPKAHLELMGYRQTAELAHKRFYLEKVSFIDQRSVAAFFARKGELDESLRHYFSDFDLVVSYLYDPDEIFQNNLRRACAPRVIAADCRPDGQLHATQHLARWLSQINLPTQTAAPRLYPSEEDLAEAETLLSAHPMPTVALHPGSGSPTKNWPLDRWLDLAAWLKGKKYRVAVVTGPAEFSTEQIFRGDTRAEGCLRCHQLPLTCLAGVLKKCRLFIGHDSGISHMAAAVDTPTIALFGPTDPRVWAPRGKNVRILRRGNTPDPIALTEVTKAVEQIETSRAD